VPGSTAPDAAKDEEMIMKYVVALCLLAAPLALASAPTPAEAGFRDGGRCHIVKKVTYRFGKKHVRWTKVCKPQYRFNRHWKRH
jgi:hypothetical protein